MSRNSRSSNWQTGSPTDEKRSEQNPRVLVCGQMPVTVQFDPEGRELHDLLKSYLQSLKFD